MAIPILETWKRYFLENPDEGLGSSYERVVINLKFDELIKKYDLKSCLETPSFGFTGISGINSMWLSHQGLDVKIIDNDKERINLIKQVWDEIQLPVELIYQDNLDTIPLKDKSIDFAWNYSALWFIDDLEKYLNELNRTVSKVIMLCVPNRSGLGYLSQKYLTGVKLRNFLNEDNIIPKNFIPILNNLGWKLVDHNYFDCPPWPDIGMGKEELLGKIGLGKLVGDPKQKTPINILNHYKGIDDNFKDNMLSLMWLEKIAPNFIKFFWAHHKFYIFTK